MAGLYFHIPYCKQACVYCNFHFSTVRRSIPEMVAALKKEVIQRRDYLEGETLRTIYFGGGTPSLLPAEDIGEILEVVRSIHPVTVDAEITLEANPDDLDNEKLKKLYSAGINRLSIGIQSFDDVFLRIMNRAHSSKEAFGSIESAQNAGFENITIDLIYGIPGQSEEDWIRDLNKVSEAGISHFSAYSLTVEEKTALAKMIQTHRIPEPDEEMAKRHFFLLQDWAAGNGFDAYEISNYSKPGYYSKHNSAYWTGEAYLGIGPSAHSYNGAARHWNIANNHQYIKLVNEGAGYYSGEEISTITALNEYLMTGLRRSEGISLKKIASFGSRFLREIQASAKKPIADRLLTENGDYLQLTSEGKWFSDGVIRDLFIIDEE